MHQNFDATLTEFLAKTKVYIEQQNDTLNTYERAFGHAQEALLAHSQFVHDVLNGLEAIQSAAQQAPVARKSKVKDVLEEEEFEEELPRSRKMEIAPKWESIDPKRILIVDDAEINRILMGHFFKRLPVTLEFAGSGEQALEKVVTHQFDLVLMDLQMKGMSGIEAIKMIRQAQPENTLKTKIIAITPADPTDEEQGVVLSAGANGYFSKAMPREALREKVLDFLISASSPGA